MLLDGLEVEGFQEANYSREPYGPSSRSCCKVTNRNSCGSGSLVGVRDGKSLVLTNAHVAGTKIGSTVNCMFPFANNKQVSGRIIMSAYSDRIMMDWAVLELSEKIDLRHVKLSMDAPQGEHYTAGYPRCQGPYFQKLQTTRVTHSGTVWRWQPNSIGGQSGSAVHDFTKDLQKGLLTWSWAGDGAGQTTRSIWFQYVNRAAVGFERPEGLVELSDSLLDILEPGFYSEANITTLPIWDHLDEDDDDDVDPPATDPKFARQVLKQAQEMRDKADTLVELARKYSDPTGCDDDEDSNGMTFGL